jgi:prepilin-type N-terminal cleavage/methylation domain-containing protein
VSNRKQRGFSLIELLIVVAIILIIAAIAIPNLVRSRMSANEASAVGSLRTLNTACISYTTLYGGYPPSLASLGPGSPATSASADLIDSVLSSGTKAGYTFTYTAGATDAAGNVLSYSIASQPISVGATGQRFFFTDQSGVIRANTSGVADATSTPIS